MRKRRATARTPPVRGAAAQTARVPECRSRWQWSLTSFVHARFAALSAAMKILGWVVLAALVGCSSPEPVAPERAAAVERQFLQPFVDGGEIGCGELVVEVTANFVNNVAQPAIDTNLHSARKVPGDGYTDTVWTNKTGTLQGAFVVAIGEVDQFTDEAYVRGRQMKFTVLRQVTLRVFEGRREMTLAVDAKGPPLVQTRGEEVRDLRQFRVLNGVVLAQ